jgi:hypothetical protein
MAKQAREGPRAKFSTRIPRTTPRFSAELHVIQIKRSAAYRGLSEAVMMHPAAESYSGLFGSILTTA